MTEKQLEYLINMSVDQLDTWLASRDLDQIKQLLAYMKTYKPVEDLRSKKIFTESWIEEFYKNSPLNVNFVSTRTDPTYYSNFPNLTKLPNLPKIKTGSNKIDTVLHFYPGYYIVCAKPGAGKSWFSLWLARRLWKQNQTKSVLFSLEMSEPQIRRRLLQSWSNLTQDQFANGFSTKPAEDLMKQDILVVDLFGEENPGYRTPENFEKDLYTYYQQGYRVFQFDHFHEIPGATVNDSNQKVSEDWGLKFQTICKTYPDIWLIIYAQPNGNAFGKKILRMEDVRGSKGLCYKVDCMFSLNRAAKQNKETGEVEIDQENRDITLWVDKNRNSDVGQMGAKIYFSKTGNFCDSELDEPQTKDFLHVEKNQRADLSLQSDKHCPDVGTSKQAFSDQPDRPTVTFEQLGKGDVDLLKFLSKEEGFTPLSKIANTFNFDAETCEGVLDSLKDFVIHDKDGYSLNAPTRKIYQKEGGKE